MASNYNEAVATRRFDEAVVIREIWEAEQIAARTGTTGRGGVAEIDVIIAASARFGDLPPPPIPDDPDMAVSELRIEARQLGRPWLTDLLERWDVERIGQLPHEAVVEALLDAHAHYDATVRDALISLRGEARRLGRPWLKELLARWNVQSMAQLPHAAVMAELQDARCLPVAAAHATATGEAATPS